MYQLSHQVNNKPLYIALGVAFLLHFLFTLTYQIDSEWTSPKPQVLRITLVPLPTKIAAVEATSTNTIQNKSASLTVKPKSVVEPKSAVEPKSIDNTFDNTLVTAEKTKTDYLSNEQWIIVKKLGSKEMVQKLFVDDPADIRQLAHSQNGFGLQDKINFTATTCTNGVKNYVFIGCPVDRLNLATLVVDKQFITPTPLLVLPASTDIQLSLSLPVNPYWPNEFERPTENWAYLAGLPTLSIPIY